MYTCPGGTNAVVHAMYLSNVDGTNSATINLSISGSANFYNRPENCITIHRHKNEESDYVGVHVHKVRFQYKNGRPGKGKLSYDVKNGRYYEHQEEFKEALFG
jgi:twinkle protein